MSYILDALRRADAERERERGGVPGLHSMPVGSASPAAPARAPWTAVALGLAALSLLVLLAWWLWPAGQAAEPAVALTPPATPLPAAPSTSAVAQAPAATRMGSPGLAGGASAPAPAPEPVTGPVTAPAADPTPSSRPAPARVSGPAPAFAGGTAPSARPAGRESTTPAAVPVSPASPPAASTERLSAAAAPAAVAPTRPEDNVVAFEKLPDDVKRALPPLSVGGAIYSENPGSRLLMIGGQLLKEGDNAGPGVTLEQIRPRSAVLRWKDVRYEVRY